jgi:endonuclease/exonuclease/phosphatase family metal-dependent hydrolase
MRSNDESNGWELRRDLVAEIFCRYSPDIVGTQEGYWPQIEQLHEMLPEYGFMGAGRDDGDREGETCAIFYRRALLTPGVSGTFWFSDTPEIPGSRHAECNHARICTWATFASSASTPFTVYNVHLDHESQAARAQSVEILRERVHAAGAPLPSIAMGDFNMTPDNAAYRAMLETPSPAFNDSFALMHPEPIPDGTFHGFTGRTDMGRIDYIFVSKNMDIIESEIIKDSFGGRYPSDHFPILARLKLG